MAAIDPAMLVTPAAGVPLNPGPAADVVFAEALDLASTLDADEVEPKLLRVASKLVSADGASVWRVHGDSLVCPIAIGDGAETLVGRRAEGEEISTLLDGEEALTVLAVSLRFGDDPGALRVARHSAVGGPYSPSERETLERLARAAEVAWRLSQQVASNDRARDLALVMEMSREIASTLDLDRVMRSAVNLAMRALPFDRGAVALYERGACDIRAVAGAETIDPDDPELLADMVLAAANEALRTASAAVEARMRAQMPDLGALGLPGL
jgi:DNA-binding protein YbaB